MPDKRLLTGKKRISVWEKYRSEHPNPDLIPESDFGYINRLLKAQVAKCETHHTPLLVKEYERGLGDGEKHRLDRPELREKIAEWLYGTPWAWSSELKHETRTYWYTRADQILAICEEEIRKQERERIEQIADMEGGIITFKRTSVEDCILIRKADWQALKGE